MKKQKTALIVVDMFNSLTRPGYRVFYDTAGKMMEYFPEYVNKLRDMGVLIVFIASNDGYTHPRNTELSRGSGDPKYRVNLPPEAGDIDDRFTYCKDRDLFVRKYTFSAFYRTELANILRRHGVENVLVSGIKTNVCCRQTTIDAVSSGFNTIMISDMVSTNDEETSQYHLAEIGKYIAKVMPSEEVFSLLEKNEL